MISVVYPQTRSADIVDELFGQKVADPFRWLEADARNDSEVAGWIEAQNEVTTGFLASLPGREVFRDRLTALFDHEQFTAPHERGGRYFYTRHARLQNQPTLVVREGVHGEDRVLLEPNTWSDDGTVALAEWSASKDGGHVAYAVQEAGTDWRTIKVVDASTGELLEDKVEWVRFTAIAWAADGSGFFYARYPEPGDGAASRAGLADHTVYFHAIGTRQSQDRLLYATPAQPELLHFPDVTSSGRHAVIYSTPGSQTNSMSIVDLTSDSWEARTVVADFDNEWTVIGDAGSTLYVLTSQGAERRKIVTIDLASLNPIAVELVAEDSAVLSNAWLVGGRLMGTYFVDVKSEIRRYTLDGEPDGKVELPGIGSAGGFQGHRKDNEAFFIFTSFNAPTTIYRYDVAANTQAVWAAPKVGVDLGRIVVAQHFYSAKDGTRVPMFIVRRDDVCGAAPTLLHGYGSFGISMVPFYAPDQLAWVEQGGVLAIANIRGGGEYGKAWHNGARLDNKQITFDDFIAAAEYLHDQGIASEDGLAVHGESAGGLLVGAVVNQRPELFAAALPGVGVMDMLRFNRFTGGQLWVGEYGDPVDPAQARNLLAYSPYHNVVSSRRYPAVLATTADTDDRVVPAHTFKYIAALQAADAGPRPHLVRIETRAGHGAGKPMKKVIEELADKWAFAAHWTGLT